MHLHHLQQYQAPPIFGVVQLPLLQLMMILAQLVEKRSHLAVHLWPEVVVAQMMAEVKLRVEVERRAGMTWT